MIKYNERFSFEKDKYCWILYESVEGKTRKGEPKKTVRDTYHPNLERICEVIIDRSCGECENLEEVKILLKAAVEASTKYIEVLEK